jgi:methyl-accepting chemotaxis protein
VITKEAIDSALISHSLWKLRLQGTIETGSSVFNIDIVKDDHACQLGQWLNGLSTEEACGSDCIKIKELHAEFHKVAAEILELALNGNKEEALKKIEHEEGYVKITKELVRALNEWKKKL